MRGANTKISFGSRNKAHGFTIVELLIVIVVIAILASITVVAFNGIQTRARDTARKSDIATISKALELFYIDNGYYPLIRNSGGTTISGESSTTADGSWEATGSEVPPYFNSLKSALVPKYISKLPRDPINTQNIDVRVSTAAYAYMYFGSYNSNYCNRPDGQMYILVYRNESAGVTDKLEGACPAPTLGPYANGVSNTRIVR